MRSYQVIISTTTGRFSASVSAFTSVDALRLAQNAFGAPFHTMVVRRVMS